MNKKQKVLKAFLVLAAVIAACMYFSRTIQTITTPKVKLVQATSGRIEQREEVTATPYFPVRTEITLTKAKDYPITVQKVYVKPGLFVKEGEVIFTATVNDYDKKAKDLTDEYNKKAQELIDLDIANRKSSKQSMQNDLYNQMIDQQDALSEAESAARLAAAKENIDLSFDQSTWQAKAEAAGASQEVLTLIQNAATVRQSFNAARDEFYRSYENKKVKIKDDVFKYINSRNTMITDMSKLSDDMVALQEAAQSLGTVTAVSDGYVVELELKEKDVYDGVKSAYTIAKKEDAPILRADITELKKDVTEGSRVEVKGEYETFRTKVTAVVNDTDGKKYAEIELTDDVLKAAGGMTKLMQDKGISAKLVFRSRKNATIVPASSLRFEGDNAYIFIANRTYGGFLSSGQIKAKKTSVTIIDRNDTEASVEEDLSHQEIIDKADRTVEDDKPVMEYVE